MPNMPHASVDLTIVVIAKECVPGRVKTRLSPPFSGTQAADLAAASLSDTLRVVSALPVARRVLAFAGTAPPEAAGFEVIAQPEGGLDERLAAAFEQCRGRTLLVGMDTPQLSERLLAPVLTEASWAGTDAWFGPAHDGGFWALGFAEPQPELIRGVPMSAVNTGDIQRRRLLDAGLRVAELPQLRDVDTITDARAVAAVAPDSAFARVFSDFESALELQLGTPSVAAVSPRPPGTACAPRPEFGTAL
ncbi:MAG: TIGR04282 family arsenosugar biosynthesis glycosyltransferase [Mycobacteriales bacterium]